MFTVQGSAATSRRILDRSHFWGHAQNLEHSAPAPSASTQNPDPSTSNPDRRTLNPEPRTNPAPCASNPASWVLDVHASVSYNG